MTPPDSETIARVVAGLSPAMRDAVVDARRAGLGYTYGALRASGRATTNDALGRLGICRNSILTPLGLAVRALLADGGQP